MSRRLAVVVPCRNEARVVGRKLANLAAARWPESDGPHRIVVVDDGSDDGTAERARAAARERFDGRSDVRVVVTANDGAPGKAGAIARGLAEADGAELVVLTDADVVVEPGTLCALAEAFDDPSLAMASGAQLFVRDLADDGSARAADGGAPVAAGALFDRFTARVRRLESRRGKLFSVHGQLLAWRAALALAPAPGIAADDLDLVLAVRARGGACRLVPGARFLEVKAPRDARGEGQALRRARAYFQAVLRPGLSLGPAPLDRLQWAFYAWAPRAAPELLLCACAAAVALALALGGARAALAAGAGLALLAATPPGREALFLARVIRAARRPAGLRATTDRWEMERT